MTESRQVECSVPPTASGPSARGSVTTHEFSFGDHYDPDRISFGPLVAHNVETLAAGEWIRAARAPRCGDRHLGDQGVLEHNDDHGHLARLRRRAVQRLTAAAGVTHAEINAEHDPVDR